jgi:RNA polymerase sigma-70 factor (ECF subfamily)
VTDKLKVADSGTHKEVESMRSVYVKPAEHVARPPVIAPVLVFEEVYREHFAFVYRKAARLGGPSIDAEDAAQEVFLVVSRKLDTFDGTSLLTTWLYGITLNVVRSMRRRAFLRRLWEQKADAPSDVAIQSIDRAEVMAAHRIAYQILDSLSPKKREVFILAEFEELSCEEIATIVGTKTETVWSRLHYAREEFSRRLEKRKVRA